MPVRESCVLSKWNHMNEIGIKTQTKLKLGIGNHASPQSYYDHHTKIKSTTNAQVETTLALWAKDLMTCSMINRKMQTTTTTMDSKNACAGILCIDQMESYERNWH